MGSARAEVINCAALMAGMETSATTMATMTALMAGTVVGLSPLLKGPDSDRRARAAAVPHGVECVSISGRDSGRIGLSGWTGALAGSLWRGESVVINQGWL